MTDVSGWTSDDWQKLGTIDPDFERELLKIPEEFRTFRKSQGIEGMRAASKRRKEDVIASIGPPPASITEEESTVTARDGFAIPIKTYRPKEPPSAGSPLIVWYHGGGLCIGGFYSEDVRCRSLAEKYKAVVISVEYRLAPEHPFPTPVYDCYDVLEWAAANASPIGANPSAGFILGGTSAGANLTGVCALLARDNKLSPSLTGLAFLIPAFTCYLAIPDEYASEIRSYQQNADAPILGMEGIEMFMTYYAGDNTSKMYNILTPPFDYANLPPSFFQICGLDCLRDEAFVFELILREKEGIKMKVFVYDGVPHAFYSAAPGLEKTKRYARETDEGVGWLLAQ